MNKTIEAADLSALIMKSEDFLGLTNSLDVYCPFEALSVARMEIRHSNFLADIVDPTRPHGFDDACTRALLETLLASAGEPELLLRLHLSDLGGIEVMREWRHIDLLLRLPKTATSPEIVFAIELKVEAGESTGQLDRYRKIVEETWPAARHFFFFLTVRQDASSAKEWIDVGFADLLENLDVVVRKEIGHPTARIMLASYIQMLRRRYLEDPVLDELAQKIWAQHKNALEFLLARKPNPAQDLLKALTDAEALEVMNAHLKEVGGGLTIDVDSIRSNWVYLAIPNWDRMEAMHKGEGWTPTNRILLIEVLAGEDGATVKIAIGPGQAEARQAIYGALESVELEGFKKARSLTNRYTTMFSISLLGKRQVEKIISDGLDQDTVNTIRMKLAALFARSLPALDEALNRYDFEAPST
ncbi:PD-(D/E)XK nuclease family protein [Leisingera sp. XS_AS12]|uniref:PDDEXK-like family protein n=1 Tax=Leisingera sp. XS_AS12 TaxID=3241294 RepID=UPI0035181FE2